MIKIVQVTMEVDLFFEWLIFDCWIECMWVRITSQEYMKTFISSTGIEGLDPREDLYINILHLELRAGSISTPLYNM